MNLVTIKTFSYDHETLIYEPAFQAEGIQYFLKDQKTVAVDPLVSNAIGGIKLQVSIEDEERARALVAEIEAKNTGNNLGDEIVVNGKKYEKILFECPKCESDDVYQAKLSLLGWLNYPFTVRKKYCRNCGMEW
ncbi:MAG: hypothetical protein GC178_00550 [Flavobacteriales bacterium]|nr:hypothetical protein [Flavobacteriales bacterium]